MMTDIATILWKEFRELVVQRPNFRGGWVGLLVTIGVFGIVVPLQAGRSWLTSPTNLILWGWVPFLLVSGVIADSFAGERERHTLETLLASRLSDRAILFGKIAAGLLYGWGLTLLSVLLGLVTTNIAFWSGRVMLYPPSMALGILALSFLVSLLSASLGVVVSLRASTVRQAQQTFNLIFLLFFVPLFFLPALPDELRLRLVEFLSGANITAIALSAALLLAVADVVLLAIAVGRFRRARLILD